MMDPYVSLMAAAAATTTLHIGTGIALLMERELFSQAKTIATVDRLSAGRLMIGCGVGWNEEEFENATSLPWKRRYLALKETVAAQRALFTQAEPEYHGELIDFDKRLKINVYGGDDYNDFVRKDLRVMLDDLARRGDRQKLFWAKIVLD